MKLGVMRFAGKSESVQATGQKTHTVTFIDDEKNKLTLRVTSVEYEGWSAGDILDPSTLFDFEQKKIEEYQ